MLDVRTLAFVSGLGGFIMAATIGGIYLAGTRQRALLDWAVGGLTFGLGYLVGHILMTLTGVVPTRVAAALANVLIGMGHVFILTGVQRYLGRSAWTWTLMLPIVLIFAVMVLVPALGDRAEVRIIIHSIVYLTMIGAAGILLWRAVLPGLTGYRRATAVVLFTYATFLATRASHTALATDTITDAFAQHPFQMGVFLFTMMFGFVLTMALVVMIFREKEMRMRRVARRDALTGLHNRYALAALSVREFDVAKRYGRPLSIIGMDLDHFKAINDRFGHPGGDQVLVGVAAALTEALRDADLVFRVGGEEFLMLLPCTGQTEALEVAERLRFLLEQSHWGPDTTSMRVTASFGVAEIVPEQEDWDQALLRTDRALYRAKEAGRNRVELADPAPPSPRPAARVEAEGTRPTGADVA